MTSNLLTGSSSVSGSSGLEHEEPSQPYQPSQPSELDKLSRDDILKRLQRFFRPEFLNRIDDIVVFHSLSEQHLVKIVDIQLARLKQLLAERKITLHVTEAAKRHLAQAGWAPAFGARPLKRAIQRELQDPLSLAVLEGKYREGSAVTVDADGDTLVLA